MRAKALKQDLLGGLDHRGRRVRVLAGARPVDRCGGRHGARTLPKGLAVLLGGLGVLLVLHSVRSESMGRWSVRGPLFVLGGLVLWLRSGRSASRSPASRSPGRRSPQRGALARDAHLRRADDAFLHRALQVRARASDSARALAGGLLLWSFEQSALGSPRRFPHQSLPRLRRLPRRHADRRAARRRADRHDRDADAAHAQGRSDRRAHHARRHLLRRAVRRLSPPPSSSTCPARSPRW